MAPNYHAMWHLAIMLLNLDTHLQKRPFLFSQFHDSNNRDGYEWYNTHTPAISNCPSGINVVTIGWLGDLEHTEDYDALWIRDYGYGMSDDFNTNNLTK